ncbi:MAG: hypothetical protein IPH78_14770 [Bacteroidetes bacterium]|nr:hypothetical protein [Bacteroidota bacterium]
MLGNDVEVSADITDNNIPIQPEAIPADSGVRQNFIQIRKDRPKVIVGDFDLSQSRERLMCASPKNIRPITPEPLKYKARHL